MEQTTYANFVPGVPDAERVMFLTAIRPSTQQAARFVAVLKARLAAIPRTAGLYGIWQFADESGVTYICLKSN
jgi:hypothetical protein